MQTAANINTPALDTVDMLDLSQPRTERSIRAMSHTADQLQLRWDDGRESTFHALWLRDNCACPQCRHPQALERTFKFVDHPVATIVAARALGGAGVEVSLCVGSEPHVARFSAGWLRQHCNGAAAQAERVPQPRLWDAAAIGDLVVVDFADYMGSDRGLRIWLEALCSWGVVLLRNVPTEPGKLLEVAHRIGPIRNSNFGEYYDVVSMPNPNASAYTAMALEPHTDLANWRFPPDYQLLCCVESNVVGGESILVDGFRVAADLRTEDPEAFELLTTYALDFRFHDNDCDIRASGPTIELDRHGNVERIRFNNWLRTSMQVPAARVAPLYRALGEFWRRVRQARYQLQRRLDPGELITYYNHRMLHGRESFDPSTGQRHLQGCYIYQEDVMSRLRLLDR